MPKSPCPHCGRPSITEWRRACLGPAVPTHCSVCGLAVGVPWWSIITVLPISTSIMFTHMAICAHNWAFAVAAAAGVAETAVSYRLIPLVKR